MVGSAVVVEAAEAAGVTGRASMSMRGWVLANLCVQQEGGVFVLI